MSELERDRARLITSDIIEIPASIEDVWAVLTDFANYGSWNPLCSAITVTPHIGGTVRMTVHDPRTSDPLHVDYALCAMERPVLLAWEKDFHEMALRARRDQALQRIEADRTLYFSTDLYDGPGAKAAYLEHADWVRESLGEMGRALRAEVGRRTKLRHDG